jgi:hypothetical protein
MGLPRLANAIFTLARKPLGPAVTYWCEPEISKTPGAVDTGVIVEVRPSPQLTVTKRSFALVVGTVRVKVASRPENACRKSVVTVAGTGVRVRIGLDTTESRHVSVIGGPTPTPFTTGRSVTVAIASIGEVKTRPEVAIAKYPPPRDEIMPTSEVPSTHVIVAPN